jgi:hypothetical protein
MAMRDESVSTATAGSGIQETPDGIITVKIIGLKNMTRVVDGLLSSPEKVAEIRTIEIIDENEEEETVQEEHNEDQPIDCAPINHLLDTLHSSAGILTSFTWTSSSWYAKRGMRPAQFWSSLWAHAPTLRKLELGFYTHELDKVSPPPTQVRFPELADLRLDASTAHGDDGDAIEHILQNSPKLERLDFTWPGCDLKGCQIQNISWDYDLPCLKRLEARGYDFDRYAFSAFLARCENLEVFLDGLAWYAGDPAEADFVDGVHIVEAPPKDAPQPELPVKSLQRLRTLWLMGDRKPRSGLKEWFDPAAARQIRHLVLSAAEHEDLEQLVSGRDSLRTLEIGCPQGISGWRPEGKGRWPDGITEDENRDTQDIVAAETELNVLPERLKRLLPQLTTLRELGLSLESGFSSMVLPNGEWGHAAPMDEHDLVCQFCDELLSDVKKLTRAIETCTFYTSALIAAPRSTPLGPAR